MILYLVCLCLSYNSSFFLGGEGERGGVWAGKGVFWGCVDRGEGVLGVCGLGGGLVKLS